MWCILVVSFQPFMQCAAHSLAHTLLALSNIKVLLPLMDMTKTVLNNISVTMPLLGSLYESHFYLSMSEQCQHQDQTPENIGH